MLVQDFVEIDVPFEQVVAGLTEDELSVLAFAAYRRGERMAVGPTRTLAASVDLKIGEPIRGMESLTIPIEWSALGGTSFFPRMVAELVVAPLPDDSTQIGLRGSYEAPLDGVGKLLDRLALHRVAESTVRSFLNRLAQAVETETTTITQSSDE